MKRKNMMSKPKIEQPKLTPNLEEVKFDAIYLEEEPQLMECRVCDEQVDGTEVDKAYLSKVGFKNVSFTSSKFHHIDLTDAIFESCNLSNASFNKGIINRVIFRDCKLLGVDFSECNLGNVCFENCDVNLSSFADARLKQVSFDHSSLRSANYYGCKLTKVYFNDTDINDVDFTQTSLKGIDLSTCTYERINVTFPSLQGCEVSPEQAIGFSKLLGLKVKS
ncbi:pentapeptide repeat-containing protein [Paenibacillus puldeungensis]